MTKAIDSKRENAGSRPKARCISIFPTARRNRRAALTLTGEAVRQAVAHRAESSESALVFLTRVARGMASDLEQSGYREGCPIATTALEIAARSDGLGAATRGAFQKWENAINRGLERFDTIPDDADSTATSVLSLLEGALLLARTHRSLEPTPRAEPALALLLRSDQSI